MKILFFLISLTFITSCTVEKRLYNKGYHLEWRAKKRSGNTPEISTEPTRKAKDLTVATSTVNPKIESILLSSSAESTEGIPLEQNDVVFYDNASIESSFVEVVQPVQNVRSVDEDTAQSVKIDEPEGEEVKRDGMAIASLVLGILGLSVLAIIFGAVQLNRIGRDPDSFGGGRMARAGVILGCLFMILSSALLAFFYGSFFIPLLLGISIAGFVVGMIQLMRRGEKGVNNFGIFLTIVGWLGVIFTTLLVFP